MDDNTSAVLELDGERTVTFRDRGHAYTYTFSRIGAADWMRCFENTAITSRRDGKNGVVCITDVDSASMELVENKVIKAEGYDGDFMQDAKWKQFLPFGHVRAAAQLLRDGNISPADDSRPLNPLKVEVSIDAKWNMSAPGEMRQFSGLIHRFHPPTGEHKRKYNRAVSQTRVVGDPRSGTTIFNGGHRMLVDFYDQLIASVEGYMLRGQPLTSAEQIRAEMDAAHKVIAVEQLFAAPTSKSPTPQEEEAAA
jgi:hypothetical protein